PIPTKTPPPLVHSSGRCSSFSRVFAHVFRTREDLIDLFPYFAAFVIMQSICSLVFIALFHLFFTSWAVASFFSCITRSHLILHIMCADSEISMRKNRDSPAFDCCIAPHAIIMPMFGFSLSRCFTFRHVLFLRVPGSLTSVLRLYIRHGVAST
ncbi:unnamed protein product, partial [Mycena citricolor]